VSVAALLALTVTASVVLTSCQVGPNPSTPSYAILGWNSLGMHCYNQDSSDFLVLPPYNTLFAQVIQVADPPQIVTGGIDIDYRFPQNTYSAGDQFRTDKTNFWQNAPALFNVTLEPNVGLAGKALTGTMDAAGNHFIAEGIPLTEYRDEDVRPGRDVSQWPRYPYQLASLTASSIDTGAMLAVNTIVAPVSSELSCDNCHLDDGDATTRYPITPTGKVETNILTLHDYLSSAQYPAPYTALLMDSRPVLCAKCHASNALGAAGMPGVSNLSNAMHNHHKDLDDITPDTNGCYKCHPGPQTQCLRDTMSQGFSMSCVTCHGTIDIVAQNTDPWLNEPRCDNVACHGSGYALNQPLYRNSTGHGGVFCAGCHDSPHAVAPSRESNDAIKFVNLQGHSGTLRECTVCHLTQPTAPFVHHAP
jgi:predicted CxxxxCH...CXXCH cytochrome family protein